MQSSSHPQVDQAEASKSDFLDNLTSGLPSNLTSEYLLDYKSHLEKLLSTVTREVSELILSHQPTYVEELQRIADLQKSITGSIRVCTQGRSYLRYIKDGTVKNGSSIVENHKKRKFLVKLLDSLIEINDLRKSVLSLIENQEDYPKAIQMCKDGRAMLKPFESYKCVIELGQKLNDTIEGIHTRAIEFFNSYHKASLDELKMFLDNESWNEVPVRSDFKLAQLKEFSFLRTADYQINKENSDISEDIFNLDSSHLPLDKISLPSESDDDLDSELNKDFVEEDEFVSSDDEQINYTSTNRNSGSKTDNISKPIEPEKRFSLTRTSGPILTNSSLTVLRLFGRYIQMMSVLEPISYEILMKIYSLLDHYIMAVYKKFGPYSDKKTDDKNVSPKLKLVIRSIRESLIGVHSTDIIEQDTNLTVQQGVPNINNMLSHDFTHAQGNSDEVVDPKKAIAVESLIYLVNQLWNLHEYLESLIPAHLRPQLREQFSQRNSIVPDFLKARAEMDADISFSSSSS